MGGRTPGQPFAPEEIRAIHQSLHATGTAPPCPRCGAELEAACTVASVVKTTWHVKCDNCRLHANVTDTRANSLPRSDA